MTSTTIIAKNLKDALKKARSQYRGNLVVKKVTRKAIEYEITLGQRKRHTVKAIKRQWEKLIRYDGKYHYYIARNGRKVFTDRKR